ncbi:hypothetical protein ACFVY9_12280 [Streptomyces sp. NPDC059544]|uniref:hypothetical protein n=1 Tax=Streptomyces sp. NPDC059544 TaxID=3346861 RepID=UPI003691846A
MAMVGLFWITEDSVYVGSPPAVDGRCVRLDAEGVQAIDEDGAHAWRWTELRSATVEAVPVRGTAGRGMGAAVGRAIEALLTAGIGLGSGPPEMTLCLATADGTEEVPVHCAAAGGYGSEEIALSRSLLARLVAGTADLGAVEAWGRSNGGHGTPKPPVREALLRGWTEP